MTHPSETALTRLRAALGEAGCLTGPDLARARCHDMSGLPSRGQPLALLRPASTAEVSAALRICHDHDLPVVPQGGLTGLAGGANAGPGEVALSLQRLSGVEEIDPQSACMTVRAGTVLQTAQEAALASGFELPIDLGARGSCQIGGVLATNAGGVRVIRHGTTRQNVLGLEAVLSDGTILSHLSKMTKDNTGYDLRGLITGSEGTLAVITRAVLRLVPQSAPPATVLCALPDFAAAETLLQVARRDLSLHAFEIMWRDHFEMSGGRGLFNHPPAVVVLLECDPPGPGTLLERMFDQGVIEDAIPAQSLSQARHFWEIRESRAAERSLKGLLNLDVSLPVGQMDGFVTACRGVLSRLDARALGYFFGHMGDGNLHVMVDLPGWDHARAEGALQDAVYPLLQERGGSISAEHGIGLIKRPWLGLSRNRQEIVVMQGLKAALDPKGLLNPGKLLPPSAPA